MRYIHPSYLKVKTDTCLLNESHNYQNGLKLLELIGNNVFVDLPHVCLVCEKPTARKYAIGVNDRAITYSYELHKDTTVETAFDNLIMYSNIRDDEQSERLRQLQKDLIAFNREKKYDSKPVTEEQKINYLLNQNYFIKDFRDDKSNPVKYTVHMPLNRVFTLASEMSAIYSLSTIQPEAHPYSLHFVIYKDDGDGSK